LSRDLALEYLDAQLGILSGLHRCEQALWRELQRLLNNCHTPSRRIDRHVYNTTAWRLFKLNYI